MYVGSKKGALFAGLRNKGFNVGDAGLVIGGESPGGITTYNFGSLTRSGAGAVPAPAGATSIVGGTATGYSMSGAM